MARWPWEEIKRRPASVVQTVIGDARLRPHAYGVLEAPDATTAEPRGGETA